MLGSLPVVECEATPADEGVFWNWASAIAAVMAPGRRGKSFSRTFRTALHGGTWTLIGYGGTQLLRTGGTIILARLLLGPKEFGLVALVNVFLGGLDMLSDLGIGMDVVQHRRGDDPDFINTAFLIQAGRGLVLWAIATLLAFPFARFYNQPALVWLAMVGAISIGLRGLTNGSVWTMTRHVQLRKLSILTLVGEGVGFLVTLAWALAYPGAWALVLGRVAGTLFFVAASHFVMAHPVSTRWDRQSAREILYFGGGILISTSTYFLAGEAERLVVGKFVSLVELGCFSLALTISSASTAGLRQVIGQVFFPLMAERVRSDPAMAARQFRSVRLGVLAVSVGLGLTFILGSRWVVALLLGPKYAMTGWILQLLGSRAVLELFTAATASMLFTAGTSRYAAIGNVLRIIFLAGGLAVALSHFGFRGAVWVLAVAPIPAYLPLVVGLRKHFPAALRVELASFAALLASAMLAAGIPLLIR